MSDFQRTPPALNRNRHLTQTGLSLLMLAAFIIAIGLTSTLRVEGQPEARPTPDASASDKIQPQLAAAWDRLALIYADLSRQQLEQGYVNNALHLALESLAHYDQGIYRPESSRALINALDYPLREVAYLQDEDRIDAANWNRDGSQIMTRTRGRVRVWDAETHELRFMLPHQEVVGGTVWNKDETRILSWAFDGVVNTWDALTGEKLLHLSNEYATYVVGATWNRDETKILSWTAAITNDTGQVLNDQGDIIIWDAVTGEVLLKIERETSISGAVWSSDESRLLSWERDGSLYVWDAETGEMIFEPDHSATSAAWSDDSTKFLSYGADNKAVIWDATTGDPIHILIHEGQVMGAAWRDEDTNILTWSSDMTVRVWSAENGIAFIEYRHDDRIGGAIANSDASRIVSWSDDGVMWFEGHRRSPHSIEFDSAVVTAKWNVDESRLLIWLSDNTVHLWDEIYQQKIGMIRHPERIWGMGWHPDGQMFMTYASDSILHLWRESRLAEAYPIENSNEIYSFRWIGDTRYMLAETYDGGVLQVDVTTGKSVPLLEPNDMPPMSLGDVSPDSTQLLTVHGDNIVHLWDAATRTEIAALTFDHPVEQAEWIRDGRHLLTIGNGDYWVWDVEAKTPILKSSFPNETYRAALSHDLQRIILSGSSKVIVLNTLTGETIHEWNQGEFVGEVSWSPDDSRILSWGQQPGVQVRDSESGEILLTLPYEQVWNAKWNPDATRILTTAGDHTARLWDAYSGELIAIMQHDYQGSTPIRVKWSHDGSLIVTISHENIAKVWDGATGVELFAFPHSEDVNSAHWGIDDTRLFTVIWSIRDTIVTWSLDLHDYITLANARLLRPLNNQELQQFFMPTYIPSPTPTLDPNRFAHLVAQTQTARLLTATAVTLTPSPTAFGVQTAHLGENRGEIPDTGGEVWRYAGKSGEVLTINVLADRPANEADDRTRRDQRLLDTYVLVRAPDGTTLLEADDISPGVLTNTRIEGMTLPEEGVYEIEVRAWDNLGGGAYTLVIESNLQTGLSTPMPTPN